MKDIFSMRSMLRLKEFNKKNLICEHSANGIQITWFNPNFTGMRGPEPNLKMHWHTFYEVHFILDGFVRYQGGDGQSTVVNAGEFIFIPPRHEHVMTEESDTFKKIGLAFSVSESDAISYVFPEQIYCMPITEEIADLFSVISLALERTNGSEVSIIINSILSLILFLSDRVIDRTEYSAIAGTDERVARAKRFIEDNTMRNVSVGEVASFVCLSTKQLGRLFREAEGMTVSEFIARHRCKRAKVLLEENELSLSQIAEALAFPNEYNFNRYFKRTEGITPGVYRKVKGRT